MRRFFNREAGAISVILITGLATLFAAEPAGAVPITSGLKLWLDGTDVNGDGVADSLAPGTIVTSWKDKSPSALTASQSTVAYQPIIGSLNGKQIVSFTGDDFLTLAGGPAGNQTLFVVYKDTSTQSWVTPVGTTYNGKGSYHGNNNDGSLFNGTYTDPLTRNGTNLVGGGPAVGNGDGIPRPDNWTINAYIATGPLPQTVTVIGADNCCSNGRAINGGIGEVILYNRPLSFFELNVVGNDLSSKYTLGWNDYYPTGTFLSNVGSGNWSSAGNWSIGGGPPGTGQTAVVVSGDQITYDAAASGTVGTVGVVDSGSQLTLARSLNATSELYVGTGSTLAAGTQTLSSPKITVADGATFSTSGPLTVTTLDTAGNTTLASSGGGIGTVNANGGTTNLAGATLDSLNVLGSTVNVTANSTATNLLVNTPTGSVNITGGDLATSNGQLQSGLVATSGSQALVVSDGGTLKVGSNITIGAAGATARILGSDIINPTAGQHNTLSLVGGTVTLTGELGPSGAAADTTNLRHQWEFAGNTNDSMGTASPGTLFGTATVVNGRLQMSGSSGNNRMTATLNNALAYNKTLMAWFTLDSLTPNNPAGGPLGVQNSASSLFDSIDYGERTGGQWMAGSDFFHRSYGVNNGGAIETVAGNEIMMAITYDSVAGQIKLYRNGALYAQYAQTTYLQTYDAAALAVFGPRVGTAGYFNGAVNEARIYDAALSGSQISAIYNSFYSPLDINMPFWDVEVNHTTTLELDATADVVLGDLIINLGAHTPPDTILEILSDASSISWDNLIINGPAASGQYTLVDWSDWTGASDAFFDGMFDNVFFNGVSGSLMYLDNQIIFNAQAEAVPEPGTLALAIIGSIAGATALVKRRARLHVRESFHFC